MESGMPRLTKTPSIGDKYVGLVELGQGGHGTTTAEDGLSALGGIDKSMVGVANGPIPLRADGTIDPKYIEGLSLTEAAVDGDPTIETNETKPYFLTTYDSYTDYVIKPIVGSVSVDKNLILYTADKYPGIGGFTINERKIFVYIQGTAIDVPTFTSPVADTVDESTVIAIKTSAFSVTGGVDTHASTDWEVATDEGFASVIASSYDDGENLTTWCPAPLTGFKKYYIRARHNGVVLGVGRWSTPISITTGPGETLVKQYKIYANDPVAGDRFGHSVAMNADATIALISAMYDDDKAANAGCVYVYTREAWSATWVPFTKLYASDPIANGEFGSSLAMNGDGTIALIGATLSASSTDKSGVVYVFTRTGTVWSQSQKITVNDPAAGAYFGRAVALSKTGDLAIIGCPMDDTNGTDVGAAYIFTLDTTTSLWTQQAKLFSSAKTPDGEFGYSVTVDATGNRIVVGAYLDGNGAGLKTGAAYVFDRDGVDYSWNEVATLVGSDSQDSDYFGVSTALVDDGTTVLIGAAAALSESVRGGCVYAFRENATKTAWMQTKYVPTGLKLNDLFGYSAAITSDTTAALFGAAADDDKGVDAGAVYFYANPDLFTKKIEQALETPASGASVVFDTPGVYYYTVPPGGDKGVLNACGGGGVGGGFSFNPAGYRVVVDIGDSSDDTTYTYYTTSYGAMNGGGAGQKLANYNPEFIPGEVLKITVGDRAGVTTIASYTRGVTLFSLAGGVTNGGGGSYYSKGRTYGGTGAAGLFGGGAGGGSTTESINGSTSYHGAGGGSTNNTISNGGSTTNYGAGGGGGVGELFKSGTVYGGTGGTGYFGFAIP